tara:strand:- start:737 stop:1048 length:312 start_codon:yes stop_codon:yes gene_type:complete
MRRPIDDFSKEETAATAYNKAFEQVLHILDAVKGTLDIDGEPCSECSTNQKHDWRQFQAYEALTGAITRITKANFLIDQSMRLPIAHNAQEHQLHFQGDADNG